MRSIKGVWMGVVGLAGLATLAVALFHPSRPEYLRVPVTLHGALDGNGEVHDLQLVIGDHVVHCTPLRAAVYCPTREPVVRTLLDRPKVP